MVVRMKLKGENEKKIDEKRKEEKLNSKKMIWLKKNMIEIEG